MKYRSISEPIDFDFSISMQRPLLNLSDQHMKAPSTFIGKLSNDYLQLLPKFALQYEWKKETVYMLQFHEDIVQEDIISRCSLTWLRPNSKET